MTKLIDTNIIIRYLIGDNQKLLEESFQIFKQISKAELKVHILDTVLMECLFVLIKFYKLPKNEVINDLKKILSLKGVVNSNKIILFEALSIFENKNLDFVFRKPSTFNLFEKLADITEGLPTSEHLYGIFEFNEKPLSSKK